MASTFCASSSRFPGRCLNATYRSLSKVSHSTWFMNSAWGTISTHSSSVIRGAGDSSSDASPTMRVYPALESLTMLEWLACWAAGWSFAHPFGVVSDTYEYIYWIIQWTWEQRGHRASECVRRGLSRNATHVVQPLVEFGSDDLSTVARVGIHGMALVAGVCGRRRLYRNL